MASHSFADDPRTLLSPVDAPGGRHKMAFWGCIIATLAGVLIALATVLTRVF
jgi:hypothetical protein